MIRSAHIPPKPAPTTPGTAAPPVNAREGGTGPRPVVRLAGNGPPTIVLAGGGVLIGLVVMLALLSHRDGQPANRLAATPVGRVESLRLPGGDTPPPLPASTGPTSTMVERAVLLPPTRFVRPPMPALPAAAAPPYAPAYDPREADRLRRGGYVPGARAHYVGGSPDGEQPSQGLGRGMFAVGGDEPGAGSGNAGRSASGGNAAGDDTTARARVMRNQGYLVVAGDVIQATLETGINTAQPGMIRAIVARDVRGFDGAHVLIPRGSRLIGEARANQQAGQNRVLAIWSRLIRPDGTAIRLDSQAADTLGANGMPGRASSRFFARFANAVLQTALAVGTNLANRNATTIVLGGTTGPATQLGGIIPGADLPPTVKVAPGTSVAVVVARDLDFSAVPRL